MIDAAALRSWANWPKEVPEGVLTPRILEATRILKLDTGLNGPPQGKTEDWDSAILYKAAELSLPFIHVFTLQGVTNVARLAGQEMPEFRFLAARESLDLSAKFEERYQQILSTLRENKSSDGKFLGKKFLMSAV